MRFYKVKPECDGRYYDNRKGETYAGELFTEKEMDRYRVNKAWCDSVEISKKKTHYFFGKRFED